MASPTDDEQVERVPVTVDEIQVERVRVDREARRFSTFTPALTTGPAPRLFLPGVLVQEGGGGW